jgi:hypothetical protein
MIDRPECVKHKKDDFSLNCVKMDPIKKAFTNSCDINEELRTTILRKHNFNNRDLKLQQDM